MIVLRLTDLTVVTRVFKGFVCCFTFCEFLSNFWSIPPTKLSILWSNLKWVFDGFGFQIDLTILWLADLIVVKRVFKGSVCCFKICKFLSLFWSILPTLLSSRGSNLKWVFDRFGFRVDLTILWLTNLTAIKRDLAQFRRLYRRIWLYPLICIVLYHLCLNVFSICMLIITSYL